MEPCCLAWATIVSTSSTPFFLAVELRTDGVALALQDKDGHLTDVVRRSVSGDAEAGFDPQDWWRAVRTGTKDLLRRCKVRKDDVRSVGICGPDQGVVCIGADGEVLSPSYLLPQPDLPQFIDELHGVVGAKTLVNLTGGEAAIDSMAVNLLWHRHHLPRVLHDLKHLLTPRDFLRFRLTGTFVTDPSTAASSRMFSPRARTWSKVALDRLGIEAGWLPQISNGHILSGRVTPSAAKETGLVAGTPVVVGGSRSSCLAMATSAINPGDLMIELGDEGRLTVVGDKPIRPKGGALRIGCHTLPDLWTLEQTGATGSRALDWFTQKLTPTDANQWRRAGRQALDMIAEIAAEAPPGADGLLFVPPSEDEPSGSFTGMGFQHERSHLLRALLEGGAFALRQQVDAAVASGATVSRVVTTGTGSSNTLWCQIVADVLGRKVTSYAHDHAHCQGTATMASVAIGCFKSVAEACKKHLPKAKTYEPRKSAQSTYEAICQRLSQEASGPEIDEPTPQAAVAD